MQKYRTSAMKNVLKIVFFNFCGTYVLLYAILLFIKNGTGLYLVNDNCKRFVSRIGIILLPIREKQ